MTHITLNGKQYQLAFTLATWLMYEQNEGTSISADLKTIIEEMNAERISRLVRITFYELVTSNLNETIEYNDYLQAISTNEQASDLLAKAFTEMTAYLLPQDKMMAAEQPAQEEGRKSRKPKKA